MGISLNKHKPNNKRIVLTSGVSRNLKNPRMGERIKSIMDRETIFESIYEKKRWGSNGTLSGDGPILFTDV